MDEIPGETVAALLGSDLADELNVEGRTFTPAQVDAIAEALAESTELAEAALDGNPDTLDELFAPSFVSARTGFEDFEAMLAASPWHREDLPAVFAGRTDGEAPPASRTSAFLERNTEFSRPGAMVRAAIIARCQREIDAL